MIDESTFLFAPHLEWVHLARALGGEGKGPGMGVWGDVEGFVGDVYVSPQDSYFVSCSVCGLVRGDWLMSFEQVDCEKYE